MDPLSKLFGSPQRLKLLRLFLFNNDTSFSVADAAFRSKSTEDQARKEMNALAAIGLVKRRTSGGKAVYQANRAFEHYTALNVFLRSTSAMKDVDLTKMLKRAGTLRLVVLSGMFTGSIESKVDILIVGDRIEERTLKSVVHTIEAELGRELRYASFLTPDFRYRAGVYDRLIRDVMDYPHRTLLDKIGL